MWTEVETTRKNAFGRARTSVAPCNLASGTPEHLLQGCENLSGAPEAKLHDATTFLVCQKHGVRRKNKKIRVEEHE